MKKGVKVFYLFLSFILASVFFVNASSCVTTNSLSVSSTSTSSTYNGLTYEIKIVSISYGKVTFLINGETLANLSAGGNYTFGGGRTLTIDNILSNSASFCIDGKGADGTSSANTASVDYVPCSGTPDALVISNTLTSLTYNGLNYGIKIVSISDGKVIFFINGETLPALGTHESYILGNGKTFSADTVFDDSASFCIDGKGSDGTTSADFSSSNYVSCAGTNSLSVSSTSTSSTYNGLTYEIKIVSISDGKVTFLINGETLTALDAYKSYSFNGGKILTVDSISGNSASFCIDGKGADGTSSANTASVDYVPCVGTANALAPSENTFYFTYENLTYEIRVVSISNGKAIFFINGETLPALGTHESYILGNGKTFSADTVFDDSASFCIDGKGADTNPQETVENNKVYENNENSGGKIQDNESSAAVQEKCNGCELDNICYPVEFRNNGKYCSVENKTFISQSEKEESCENNFECQSNLCLDSQCVSGSLIAKFLRWLKRVF